MSKQKWKHISTSATSSFYKYVNDENKESEVSMAYVPKTLYEQIQAEACADERKIVYAEVAEKLVQIIVEEGFISDNEKEPMNDYIRDLRIRAGILKKENSVGEK